MDDLVEPEEAKRFSSLSVVDYWARLNSQAVKPIARRWLGTVAQKMRRDEALAALSQALDNPEQLKRLIAGLTPVEHAGLSLLALHGGRMLVVAFGPALLAMGHPFTRQGSHFPFGEYSYTATPMYSAANVLEDGGLIAGALIPHPETTPERYYSDRRAFHLFAYSDARLLRQLVPSAPLPLEIKPLPDQENGTFRRPAEVSLRLLELVEALRRISPYPVTARGRPSKPLIRKLGKSLGWETGAAQSETTSGPTDLFYRLLVALLFVQREGGAAAISPHAESILQLPFAAQARYWAAAYESLFGWLECDVQGLWIYGEDIFDPNQLNGMRAALLVALAALPDPGGWYSVTDFSGALHTRLDGRFYLVQPPPIYAPWNAKEAQKVDIERQRVERAQGSWHLHERSWIGHALAGPLYQLGLVEVAFPKSGGNVPDRFRLTEIGRFAFRYATLERQPASSSAPTASEGPRWIVQPNFDVIAYLDRMTPAAIAFLARIAERKPSDGAVGIYRLTRESIYAALESGLTLPAVLAELEAGSGQSLPATLQRALSDWAARRERISLHLLADILEYPDAPARDEALSSQPRLGTPLGERFILVSATAPKSSLPTVEVIDYLKPPITCLHVNEAGEITVDAARSDFLVRGELSNWADPQGPDRDHWRVSAASVARAVQGGWSAEKILANLQSRTAAPLPALVQVGIRAWAKKRHTRPPAGLAKDLILQLAEPAAADAIAGSTLFQPHLRARLGPRTFLVPAANLKPLRALLEEFGLPPGSDLSVLAEENQP